MEIVITLDKVCCSVSLPLYYFLQNTRNELARPVMGTIFLVIMDKRPFQHPFDFTLPSLAYPTLSLLLRKGSATRETTSTRGSTAVHHHLARSSLGKSEHVGMVHGCVPCSL